MSMSVNVRGVDVRGLSVQRGKDHTLHDVDLTLEQGEVLAVLGPNGAGKSTLLNAVAGLVRKSAGTVSIDGRAALAMQEGAVANRSVKANVHLAMQWWGVPRSERPERATHALEQFRIDHLARRRAPTLSGGERRRLHLARTFALRPEVLMLDEPFAGLDVESRDQLCDDTASVVRDLNCATMLVLHDRADAWALADRLLVLIKGQARALGPISEVFAAPPDAEVARFLGYDGELVVGSQRLLTRPEGVEIDPHGDHEGIVRRVTRTESGALATVETAGGTVRVRASGRPSIGDRVRLRVTQSVAFDLVG